GGGGFTTIDDAIRITRILLTNLIRLGEYKHPFDVRRGVRGLTTKKERESDVVKAGSRTYFFDIQETKEGKAFLTISESRYMGEDKDRERNTIAVFPEQIEAFAKTMSRMAKKIK
ncbi:MAG: PUR family DNA/RNA-binding protein, partial [Anaerolineae bacterium]|nr:PUR family DNA/RNA-binding protein [Anaerolineae bacterium]